MNPDTLPPKTAIINLTHQKLSIRPFFNWLIQGVVEFIPISLQYRVIGLCILHHLIHQFNRGLIVQKDIFMYRLQRHEIVIVYFRRWVQCTLISSYLSVISLSVHLMCINIWLQKKRQKKNPLVSAWLKRGVLHSLNSLV